MKAFVCFVLFAVTSAIPLQNRMVVIPDVVVIADGPLPIPVQMLRSGGTPVWRDLPQVEYVPVPERNMRDFADFKVSDVQFVDNADITEIQLPNSEFVPEAVKVVEANEEFSAPVAEEIVPTAVKIASLAEETAPAAEDNASNPEVFAPELVPDEGLFQPINLDLAPELPALEDAEMRFVKFVDSPATFDMKNMKVPIDAHDIVV